MRMKITLEEVQKIETYMLKQVVDIFEKNNISYSMYAGSILGTIRHGGPIPWDSDIDLIVSIDEIDEIIQLLDTELPSPLYLDYYPKNKRYNHFYPRVAIKGTDSRWIHIDIFLYSALPVDTQQYHQYFLEAKKKLVRFHHKTDIVFDKAGILENIIRTIYHWLRSLQISGTKEKLFEDFIAYSKQTPLISSCFTTELGCNRYGEKMVFKKSYWENTVLWDYDGIKVRIPKQYDEFLRIMYGDYMKLPSEEERKTMENFGFFLEEDLYTWCKDLKII